MGSPVCGPVSLISALRYSSQKLTYASEKNIKNRRAAILGLLVLALACFRIRYSVSIPHRLRYVFGMCQQIPGVVHPYVGDESDYLSAVLAFLGGFLLGHTTSVEVNCLARANGRFWPSCGGCVPTFGGWPGQWPG